jgi:hypothetical protein
VIRNSAAVLDFEKTHGRDEIATDGRPREPSRLKNPKVHSLELVHNPDRADMLLVKLDVDDKATAQQVLLRNLNDAWTLRVLPDVNATVRSNEAIDDFRPGACGLGVLAEGVYAFVTAVVASLVIPACFRHFALERIKP